MVSMEQGLLPPPMGMPQQPQVILVPSDYYRSQDQSSPESHKRSRNVDTSCSSSSPTDQPQASADIPSIVEWLDSMQCVVPSDNFDGWYALREKFRVGNSLNMRLSTFACIPVDNIYSGYKLDMGEFGLVLEQLEIASKRFGFKWDAKAEKARKRSKRH